MVRSALGACGEIRPFYKAVKDDLILGQSVGFFKDLRIAGWSDIWEALVTTVLCQQINLAFAYGIRAKLAIAFGRRAGFGGEMHYAFPSPMSLARAGIDSLRRLQISQAKAETILRLAKAFAVGELSHKEIERLNDNEVVNRLTSVKGIGRWTAETALLRGLGRLDAFPAGDLGVVKYLAQGLLRWCEKASEQEMRDYAERWRPYRGLTLIYAYAELARRKASASG